MYIEHRYGKLPSTVDLLMKHGGSFQFVMWSRLPEGVYIYI